MPKYDIIVIGAGAAGLMTAYELSNAGKKVLVLEAGAHIGGRIHTLIDSNFSYPVELGAEFIHGDLPVTEQLLKEANIKYSRTGGKMLTVNEREEGDFYEGWDLLDEKLKEVKEDITLKQFLDTYFKEEKYKGLRRSVQAFAEGYDSADITIASTLAFRDEWLSEENSAQYRIDEGYGKLIDHLFTESTKHGCTINLSTVVKGINWRQGAVEVDTAENKIFSANKVIITVPIGVLTANENSKAHIKFTPNILPQLNAAKNIGYGYVIKILIEFDEAFWTKQETEKRMGMSLDNMSFLFSHEAVPGWWTQYPKQSTILTGWAGGSKAALLKTVDDTAIYDKAIQSLSNIFKLSIEELEKKIRAHKIVNWSAEPFILGSYSYATLGTFEARKLLTQPVQNTLYFAGEALYEGPEMGTVEAALASGLKVAKDILK